MSVISNPLRIETAYHYCYMISYDLRSGQYYYDVKYENQEGERIITFLLIDQGYDVDYNPTYEIDNEIPDVLFTYNLTKR